MIYQRRTTIQVLCTWGMEYNMPDYLTSNCLKVRLQRRAIIRGVLRESEKQTIASGIMSPVKAREHYAGLRRSLV